MSHPVKIEFGDVEIAIPVAADVGLYPKKSVIFSKNCCFQAETHVYIQQKKQAAARLISSHTLTATSRTCTHAHTHAYSHTHIHTRTCTHTQGLCICRRLQRGEASSSACDQAATFLNFASAAAGPAIQAACQGSGDPDQPRMMFSGDKLVPLASWKGASLGPDVRFGSTVTAVHYNSWLSSMPKGVVCSSRLSQLYTESTELKPPN